MLIRVLIAMGLAIILCAGGNINYKNINDNLSDISKKNMLNVMDEALITYYCHHSGNLPSKLDSATIKLLGLEQYDWEEFSYLGGTGKFTLSVNLNNGEKLNSINSGKTLQTFYNED